MRKSYELVGGRQEADHAVMLIYGDGDMMRPEHMSSSTSSSAAA